MKSSDINVRVTPVMKRRIKEIADARGESEGVIVREALHLYLEGHNPPSTNDPAVTAARDSVEAMAKEAVAARRDRRSNAKTP